MKKYATVIDMTPKPTRPRHHYLSGGLGIAFLIGASILLANIIIGLLLLAVGIVLVNQFLMFLLNRKK